MHPPMLLRFMLFTLFMGAVSQYNYRYFCPNTSTNNLTSTFETNLNSVLSNLSSKGNVKNGFYNYTAGSGLDTVYGMFMCQGDVSTGDCASCVNQASSDILRACSKQKAAIIWFDHCMLRFSDEYIFRRLDNKSAPLNMSSIEKDPRPGSKKRVEQTLEGMISKQSGKRFVTHESPIISGSKRVYSLGQCTPDLSESDCHRCLKNAVQILHTCCASALGARVLSPSCYVRYELYLFYNPEGSRNSSTKVIVGIVVAVIGIIFIIIPVLYIVRNRNVKKGNITTNTTDVIRVATEESPEYDFANIQAITNDFSIENQIGKGGYGSVYKGMFPNGQEVAIKRLSRGSVQGAQEFKNEVEVVAKLQHKNLVRLLGFCSEEEEKILIYEFVANKSLDYFLFDPDKQYQLEWSMRYNIIRGIARGLLYLHEDSRLKIIHRDLKTSNILLDADMNPKIADFGLAIIFGVDQIQENTDRIAGTYGYMSPEYIRCGEFSVKSDIFSFGVILLEIITGKKNHDFCKRNRGMDLLSYAWEHWRDGCQIKILDPTLGESYTLNEVIPCIHIGLLCVQDNANERPTMTKVMLMLNSYFANSWSTPGEPAFYRSESKRIPKEIELALSITVNEVSISELYPR